MYGSYFGQTDPLHIVRFLTGATVMVSWPQLPPVYILGHRCYERQMCTMVYYYLIQHDTLSQNTLLLF